MKQVPKFFNLIANLWLYSAPICFAIMGLVGLSRGGQYSWIFVLIFMTAAIAFTVFLTWLDQRSPTNIESYQDFWIFAGTPIAIVILMLVVQTLYNRTTGTNKSTFIDMMVILTFTWPIQFKMLNQLKLIQK